MPDSWDFSTPRRPRIVEAGTQTPLITYILIAFSVVLTLAYFVIQNGGTQSPAFFNLLGRFGTASAWEVWDGKWYALLTTIFYHGSILHILFNMLCMYRLGTMVELALNPFIYAAFVLGAALVGSTAELAWSGQAGIGMSGVVYAIFGLMWAGRGAYPAWRMAATRENLNYFLGWGVFCIIATQLHWMNVANAAHFGGLLFGLAVGSLFFAPRRQPLWAIPLAGLGVLAVLTLTWMPWSGSWNFWKGNKEFDRKHYRNAIGYYQRSIRLGEDAAPLWNNISLAWANIGDEAAKKNDLAGAQEAVRQMQEAGAKANSSDLEESKAAAKPQPETRAAQPPSLEELEQRAKQRKSDSAPTR